VEVYITGEEVGEDGMLMDFGLIKKATEKILDRLDHQFLNDLEPFKNLNPSSENIARYIYESLGQDLNNGKARVSKVTAWESDTSCAAYTES
jgi:6-pyruvoyltetrahydropterin/6-carboxytetrahydropterin synthase